MLLCPNYLVGRMWLVSKQGNYNNLKRHSHSVKYAASSTLHFFLFRCSALWKVWDPFSMMSSPPSSVSSLPVSRFLLDYPAPCSAGFLSHYWDFCCRSNNWWWQRSDVDILPTCLLTSLCSRVCILLWVSIGLCICVVGCRDVVLGRILKKMFETPYFRCVVVPDADTVEICGALKVIQCFSVYSVWWKIRPRKQVSLFSVYSVQQKKYPLKLFAIF